MAEKKELAVSALRNGTVIAIIAPGAVINTIENYEVVRKEQVTLPAQIVNLVRCCNPKCITANEPMPTRFDTVNASTATLRCRYCEHEVSGDNIVLK